ncbi:ABC transporter permease [Propioniciclava flava]|uniref:Iron ABC transporter permease n=1 Tax=Propioniciclava flava TaxID=2072026 RepID=A0A4Q2EHG2_9ACTN|nr:iron ABC transporter permease [Propioniciclava flava]RXW31315.1 iron ABC transporter permease [Propioniciclava flava]
MSSAAPSLKFRRPDFWSWTTLAAFLAFGLFLVYPLVTLIVWGFQDAETGAWTLDNFTKFFGRDYYRNALVNSMVVTLVVTFWTVIIAVPMAYFVTRFTVKFQRTIDVLIIISLLSPPFIGAYAWILLFGRAGIVTRFLSDTVGFEMPSIYGFNGIAMVFVLKLFPYLYLYACGALRKMDASIGEASESLGATAWATATKVILPVIVPTILAGSVIVFMRAIADYGTPQLIGEGYTVLPVLIYNEFIGETGGSSNFAAAISIILMAIAGLVFWVQNWLGNRRKFLMSALNPMKRRQLTGPKNWAVHAFLYLVVFVATLPQLTVVYTSFLKTRGVIFVPGFSLDSYRQVLDGMLTPIINTFVFGLMAIIIIVVVGVLVAYVSVRRANILTRVLDLFIMFPYVIPGAVLGITMLLTFNSPPLMLAGTVAILVIMYVVRRIPYTVRSSAAILHQINPNIEEAAVSLGASPMKAFWKVTLPAMMPGVLSGAILSWVTVINELSSTLILYTGKTATMSVAIFTEVMRASYGTAAALSTILTVTTVLSLLLFFKLSDSDDINV